MGPHVRYPCLGHERIYVVRTFQVEYWVLLIDGIYCHQSSTDQHVVDPFRISLHLLSLQMRGRLIRIRWNDQTIRISLNIPRNCKLHDYFDIEDFFGNRLFSMHLSLSLFESTVIRFGPFVGGCDCSYKGTKGLTTRFWNYFRRKTPTGVKDNNNNNKITAKDGQWYLFVEPNRRDFWRCGFEVSKTCVLVNVQ